MYMFSSEVSFKEAYPQIEKLTAEIKENGYMSDWKRSYSFTEENMPSELSCHNKACKKNSGFQLQPIIDEMVRNKETDYDEGAICHGKERMERDCLNTCDVKIHIEYKESPAE
jgi:hypothetical protein